MAVDYIELSEARKSSKTAMKFATWSLIISILVGFGQILVQILDLKF